MTKKPVTKTAASPAVLAPATLERISGGGIRLEERVSLVSPDSLISFASMDIVSPNMRGY